MEIGEISKRMISDLGVTEQHKGLVETLYAIEKDTAQVKEVKFIRSEANWHASNGRNSFYFQVVLTKPLEGHQAFDDYLKENGLLENGNHWFCQHETPQQVPKPGYSAFLISSKLDMTAQFYLAADAVYEKK